MAESGMELFEIDGHQVIYGDAQNALDVYVPDGSVDLIFADPPYNIGKVFNGTRDKWPSDEAYLRWCYSWLEKCAAKLKPNGSMYIMAATQNMPYLDIYLRDIMTVLSRIVWSYDSSGVQAKRFYGSLYEPILFCVKDRNTYTFNADAIMVEAKTGAKRKLIDYRKPIPAVYSSKKVPGNVWDIPRVRYRMDEYEDHPSQKPLALLERIILASSNPGDLVLDPFSGTFTTSYVAKELGRRSIGIELEEEYVKTGLRRLCMADDYKGKPLLRELRSFEKRSQSDVPSLFQNTYGA
jgi:adenine-specific DNA-methyltransferase